MLLKRLSRLHHRFGIDVLSLEIRPHFRIVLFAQPEIVIHQRAPIYFSGLWNLFSHRRRWERSRFISSENAQNASEEQSGKRKTFYWVPVHASPIHAGPIHRDG